MINKEGFTLVELIMVIVILALIAAMLLPQFGNIQGKSKSAAFKGVVGSVRAGLAVYRTNALANNLASKWPTSLEVNAGAINASKTVPFFTVIMQKEFFVTSDWARSARSANKYTYRYRPGGTTSPTYAIATYDATPVTGGKFTAQDVP